MRVIQIALIAGALITPARSVSSQQSTNVDPVSVSPDKYKVLLENDRVRVVEYSIKPGERDQPHTHPPKLSYVASGGTLRITLRDTSFVTTDTTGDVTWRGNVPWHFAQNVGTAPIRIVLFEVRRVDGEPAPLSEDPPTVNPSSLRVLLENDSVRVMEAVLPPGLKEKNHTHPPYAMYILNGGTVRMHFPDGSTRDAQFNSGEARFTDKVTHWAENTGDKPAIIVAVDVFKP